MRVALVVDSPKRDLDGLALVAYHLARQGVEGVLVPMYQQGYDVPLLAPDAIVVNYARQNNRDLLATYRALGIRVVVLDTEGGVLSESGLDAPPNWARQIRQSGLASLLDGYFFWGAAVREAFAAESGIPSNRLHVTGCPRYDFCAAPWRRLLDFPDRGYVLVNTNFSAINPRFTRSSSEEKAIFRQLGWSREYVDRLFAEYESVFPRFLEAIECLAKAQPGTRIRVRPHPFEDERTYLRRLDGMRNLVVDGSGSVLPAIANASCVVHLNCGTAVESLMLGTPAISLEFLNNDTLRSHASLPARISLHASSPDELVAMVSAPALLRARYEARRDGLIAEHLEPWFYRLDGRAAERVADATLAVVAGARRPHGSIRAAILGGQGLSPGRLVAGALSQLLGTRTVARLQELRVPARRAKAVVKTRVSRTIEAIAALHGSQCPAVRHARHPWSGAPLASIAVAGR
jgi:surface carbohydrate biosynthesis protein